MKHSNSEESVKGTTFQKFFYSAPTKFIAGLLFIMCICWGALAGIDGITKLSMEKEIVYDFESSFSESHHLTDILSEPESLLTNAYCTFFEVEEDTETPEISNSTVTVDGMNFEEYVESTLKNLYVGNKVNYFVSIDGNTYTNCGAERAEELMDAEFYRYNERKADGELYFETAPATDHYYHHLEEIGYYDNDAAITVCVNIKENYVQECRDLWEKQSAIVLNTIYSVLGFIIAALVLLIYLIITAGKNKDGELKSQLIDNMWTEFHLAILIFPLILGIAVNITAAEAYLYDQLPLNLMRTAIIGITFSASLIFLTTLLSLVRKLKCHIFLETSVICKLLRYAWKMIKKIFSWCLLKSKHSRKILREALGKKSGRILIGMLLLYTALIGLFGVLTPLTAGSPLILGILLFFFAAVVLAHRSKDLDSIKNGANAIRNGDLQYKIEEIKSEDLKGLAQDINDIAEGLDHSIEEKLKAERMKTDLITNVSHDLKTPLTSIINYTALLNEIEDLPEEAKDYIAIIAKKSEGLKNLTADLFEISKVQSGNETFHMEKLDAAQLIEQAMGEHNNEIECSGLTFCIKTEKDLCFTADGKKMSRVLGNLIDNALKYAMKNTRVFLEAHEQGEYLSIEIKNTSAAPMDFDTEEITGRFVRGDSSRTDGGNGLGLAIAKSYTEACGGTFDIIIDGDLFKAKMTFPKH